VSTFDPMIGGATAENSFVIVGRNAQGEVVTTHAGRQFDWTGSTLETEFTSMRMFYADPATSARPGEAYRITAPAAQRISGRVLYSGAGWYRKDFRGKVLSPILPRVTRALAYARWGVDYVFGVVAGDVATANMARRSGYTRIEGTVEAWHSPMAEHSIGVLVWMPADQLLDDLQAFVLADAAQVDAVVEHRSAQQA
jgi:hypothetical protein